jgi:4-hydroxybenzoate polyprenyltransferase
MSTSPELIMPYLGERYRPRVFVPLALLLSLAGALASGVVPELATVPIIASGFVVSYALVLAFRVWDDLEDRERDRVEHPARVLVHAGRRAPFIVLMAIAAVVALTLIALGPAAPQRLTVVGVLAVALLIWYRARRRPMIGAPLILAKYPVIAYVAAPVVPAATPAIALAVLVPLYIALCVYETIDDARHRGPIP